jgi:hypothetical protein
LGGYSVLQVHNETPFKARLFVFPDEDGVDTLYIVIKATFVVTGDRIRVAEQQRPITLADVRNGGEGSSLRYASEAHLCKPATDVIMVGEAYAPRGKAATEVDVALRVGTTRKVVRVFGDRYWRATFGSWGPSSPQPFVRMPLVYERAFGGAARPNQPGTPFEARNPVGVGFRGDRTPDEMEGTPLPNLEDPVALINDLDDCPAPACFGFVAPSWEPRRSRAGTYDEAWRRSRAPYLPKDFQRQYFQEASPNLVCPGYLVGGEVVEVANASREGLLRCSLPRRPFDVSVVIAGDSSLPSMALETVLVEPEEGNIALTYRGAVRVDKFVLDIQQVRIHANLGGAS